MHQLYCHVNVGKHLGCKSRRTRHRHVLIKQRQFGMHPPTRLYKSAHMHPTHELICQHDIYEYTEEHPCSFRSLRSAAPFQTNQTKSVICVSNQCSLSTLYYCNLTYVWLRCNYNIEVKQIKQIPQGANANCICNSINNELPTTALRYWV